jgi:hypothetical protein
MKITINPAGYIAFKGEELKESLTTIKEGVKVQRDKSLKQIQEETLKKTPVVKKPAPAKKSVITPPFVKKEEIIKESKIFDGDDSIPPLYATDPNDPKNAAFFAELKTLKRTNPQLYKKIVSMN